MPNTSNLALPYPALTDAPNPPSHIQSLANSIDTRLGGPWTAFTLTQAGSFNITFGTGYTQDCAYKALGNNTYAFRINITLGTGATVTSTLGIGPLPFTLKATGGAYGMLFRSTTAVQPVFITGSGTAFTRFYYPNGTAGSGAPWAWAAGDIIRVNGVLEAA